MGPIRLGFAMCGSFCTFSCVIPQMRQLTEQGYQVIPVMSEAAYHTDTRFGKAADFVAQAERICGCPVLHTIVDAEPIGPKGMFDLLVVAPCTGNTLGKLANGITDSCVTMAIKSHMRTGRPVLIGVSTNDALGNSAKNIGLLLHTRYLYFIPMRQDDPIRKPNSLVADFSMLQPAAEAALQGRQLQPLFL